MYDKVRAVALALGAAGAVGLAAVAAPAAALVPSGGTISQITIAPAGETDGGGMGRYDPGVSNNGRYVVFWSYSPTVVPGDSNNTSDVFLYDATTGVTTLISRNAAGAPANGGSSLGVISANGKFIAFQSSATDLDVGAPQGSVLVYRYNVATGRVKLASTSHTGGLPSSWSINANISSDGRYIAYTSAAHNVVRGDHNKVPDVFRYDAVAGTTIKVSQTLTGGETNKSSNSGWQGGISGDGRYVVYTAAATNMGPIDTNNDSDAYVHDVQTGTTTLASPGLDGKAAGAVATGISDNGKFVSLGSQSDQLAPGDTDENDGAFVYNANTNTVKLISRASTEWPDGVTAASTSISANGRYVTFDAIPVGSTTIADTYLYDRTTNQTSKISVTPNGSNANGGSGCSSISRSGNYLAFCSGATNLVPGDPIGATSDIFLWSRS